MSLLYPYFLWLLLPLLFLFLVVKKRSLSFVVHLLILALILLALSRPVIEKGLEEQPIAARDLIIALDVSYSMKAKDLSPTRYAFAKKTIEAMLNENSKDNVMLIAFTSNPLLLSPPTTDHALITMALESLNPEYILTKGTSLKKLFEKLSAMDQKNKTLILMTDGGEEEDAETLANILQETGIQLNILALGSKQGVTIEKEDGSILKDKNGNLVVSRINPMLKELATLTNGKYMLASASPQNTAASLSNIIEETQETQQISKKQYRYLELYQAPLFIALLLFLMLHTRASKYLLILFAFSGMQLDASVWDGYHLDRAYINYTQNDFNQTLTELNKVDNSSLQSRYALGSTYYKQGRYKKAISVWQTIRSSHAEVKQKLYYNIANAYAHTRSYDKAKTYYVKSLQLGEDADALHNLKIVAMLKEKKDSGLGIAHPKSQNSDASKSKSQEKKDQKEKKRNEDQPSSGSGSGGESQKEKPKDSDKKRLKMDLQQEEQPLSSKVYELINKGYIRETHPW